MPNLLREDDQAVFGDSAYQKKAYMLAARTAGVFWGISLKGTKERQLTAANQRMLRCLVRTVIAGSYPIRRM